MPLMRSFKLLYEIYNYYYTDLKRDPAKRFAAGASATSKKRPVENYVDFRPHIENLSSEVEFVFASSLEDAEQVDHDPFFFAHKNFA